LSVLPLSFQISSLLFFAGVKLFQHRCKSSEKCNKKELQDSLNIKTRWFEMKCGS
jgi:hypothetical protein